MQNSESNVMFALQTQNNFARKSSKNGSSTKKRGCYAPKKKP